MATVRFPATETELTLQQLSDGSAQLPQQVYIVLLNDSDTVTQDSAALLGSFVAEFGDWADHRSMFGGKMISGTLNQAQVVWLLGNDGGAIKTIEADGQVGFGDEPSVGTGGGAGMHDGGLVFAGGSPSFIEADDERTQLNIDTLAALIAASSPYQQLETLQALQGKIFNLANTVPKELETQVKAAVTGVVTAAAANVAVEPNRSLAQSL